MSTSSLARHRARIWSIVILVSMLTLPVLPANPAIAAPPDPAAASNSEEAVTGAWFYVDSRYGSDSNAGTSPDRAWRSLGPAKARRWLPGDILHFARGSWWKDSWYFPHSGNASAPIIFRAYGDGPRPVLVPRLESDRTLTIDASYVTVEGFLFRDGTWGPIQVTPTGHHVRIRDIEVTNMGYGVELFGPDNVVSHSFFHHLKMVKDTPGGDDDFGAIGVLISSARNQISFNRFEDLRAHSYDYGVDGGAIEMYGQRMDSNLINHNYARNNDGFVEVGGGSAAGTVVAYNVSHDNHGRFAWFNMSGQYAVNVIDFRIENNTIIETEDGYAPGILWFGGATPNAGMLVVRNNIFYLRLCNSVATNPNFQHDYNLYYLTDPRSQLGLPLGPNERIADPMFRSISGDDFRIRPESPAVRRGVALGYSADFMGQPIPSGQAPDVGAYQAMRPFTRPPVLLPLLRRR